MYIYYVIIYLYIYMILNVIYRYVLYVYIYIYISKYITFFMDILIDGFRYSIPVRKKMLLTRIRKNFEQLFIPVLAIQSN